MEVDVFDEAYTSATEVCLRWLKSTGVDAKPDLFPTEECAVLETDLLFRYLVNVGFSGASSTFGEN